MKPPRLRWVLVLTLFLLGLAVLVSAYVFELQRIARLSSLVDRRMDELVDVSRQIQTMKDRISFYKTDEGVARLAREDFNLAFPDEMIFRIEYSSEDRVRVLSGEP